MRIRRLPTFLLPLALTAMLLAGGCNKQNQQPNTAENPSTAQPAQPAPATSPSTGTAATPPPSAPAAAPTTAAAPPPQPPPPPPPIVIPAGTHIAVTTQQDLGSKISQPGQTFSATVAAPIRAQGVTVIPAGARVAGTVVDAKAQGKIKGQAYLELRLDTVYTRNGSIPLQTEALERVEKGKGKRTAVAAGGGAGLGAIIGGIAGGGKGAAIGALVGGAGGTAAGAYTGNKQIVIPAESTLTFRLSHSITFQPAASANQGAPEQAPPQ